MKKAIIFALTGLALVVTSFTVQSFVLKILKIFCFKRMLPTQE